MGRRILTMIMKSMISRFPNDEELGAAIRQYFKDK